MPMRAGRNAASAMDCIPRPRHRPQCRAARLPAALHRLLLHRLHHRARLRLRLRHRRQRQVDLHQHHRGNPRRLRHRRRHVDLHRQQHRTPPDRPGQADGRPPRRGAGDAKGPPLGRDQDQGADRRRQDHGPVHAPGLLRLRADLQAVHLRQPQAAADQRRRGHAPPPAAGAVHGADTAGRARQGSARRSSSRNGRQSCAG